MADKIKRPVRQAAAIALMSVGALAAVPFLVRVALERINRPESERGSRATLRSIRAIPVIAPKSTFIDLEMLAGSFADGLIQSASRIKPLRTWREHRHRPANRCANFAARF